MTNPLRFIAVACIGLLGLVVWGCSDAPVSEEPVGQDDAFIEEFRGLVRTHVAPYKETGALLLRAKGGMPSDWRESVRVQDSMANGFEYLVLSGNTGNEYLDGKIGWDVLNSPGEVSRALGKHTLREECRISFDTPVNSDNAAAWTAYGECIIALVAECEIALSHIDDVGDCVTNCVDPRGLVRALRAANGPRTPRDAPVQ